MFESHFLELAAASYVFAKDGWTESNMESTHKKTLKQNTWELGGQVFRGAKREEQEQDTLYSLSTFVSP
jgi:hypothetical protein